MSLYKFKNWRGEEVEPFKVWKNRGLVGGHHYCLRVHATDPGRLVRIRVVEGVLRPICVSVNRAGLTDRLTDTLFWRFWWLFKMFLFSIYGTLRDD